MWVTTDSSKRNILRCHHSKLEVMLLIITNLIITKITGDNHLLPRLSSRLPLQPLHQCRPWTGHPFQFQLPLPLNPTFSPCLLRHRHCHSIIHLPLPLLVTSIVLNHNPHFVTTHILFHLPTRLIRLRINKISSSTKPGD